MIYQKDELNHWVEQGKVEPPRNRDFEYFDTHDGQYINLPPNGAELSVLFKFLSFRNVSHVEDVKKSIKQRIVRIKFTDEPHLLMEQNSKIGKVLQQIDVTVKPLSPPIDGTYRFQEPENSYFTIVVPHHLVLSKEYVAEVSNAKANVTLAADTNQISL